jgi:TonB family protein
LHQAVQHFQTLVFRRAFWFFVLGVVVKAAEVGSSVNSRPLDQPPRLLREGRSDYPSFLADLEIRGSTVLEFTVNADGTPSLPRVSQVSHPAFVAPAIEVLYKSQFAPGTRNGVPVGAPMTYLFEFDVERRGRKIGRDPFSLPPTSGPDTPPEFRYDVAPRLVTLCEPIYPFELLMKDERGDAEVRFVVNREGRVTAAKAITASRPEFGAALVAAIEAWQFTPPQLDGKATMTLVSKQYKFSTRTRELAADDDGGRVIRQLRSGGDKFVTLATLSAKPRAIYQVPPRYPPLLEEQRIAGEAEVEFIIDRKGHVRAPRIVSATREEFGWAAANAVQRWFYEPPVFNGKSIDVRVRMPIGFEPALKK